MGSRKRKVSKRAITLFDKYITLSINDKIALKQWLWWYGRKRYFLSEFKTIKLNMFHIDGYIADLIDCGYKQISGIII